MKHHAIIWLAWLGYAGAILVMVVGAVANGAR